MNEPIARRCACLLPALGLALLAACASTPALTPAAVRDGLGDRVVHRYVQPHARALVSDARHLQESVAAYCERPADAARRTRVERQLGVVVAAWGRLEFLRFGALIENNRLEQFFFSPDPRGVVQRQVRLVLSAADAKALEPARLQAQSVAVQGIPALEYALYADDAARLIRAGDAAGHYRCAFAEAVAGNLVRVATEIDAGWADGTALAAEFRHPAEANKVYRTPAEVATEVLKALSTALHATRDQKLTPALGEEVANARPTLLPLQRSGLTTAFLLANVRALQEFYEVSALGAALPADARWMDQGLRDELHRVQEDLAALTVPASQALADAEQRDLLVHATLVLGNARSIIDEYLAPALGVNLGFNSLDGD